MVEEEDGIIINIINSYDWNVLRLLVKQEAGHDNIGETGSIVRALIT